MKNALYGSFFAEICPTLSKIQSWNSIFWSILRSFSDRPVTWKKLLESIQRHVNFSKVSISLVDVTFFYPYYCQNPEYSLTGRISEIKPFQQLSKIGWFRASLPLSSRRHAHYYDVWKQVKTSGKEGVYRDLKSFRKITNF